MLAKLAELRAKKAQVEQLISLISSFRGTTGLQIKKVCICTCEYTCTGMFAPIPTYMVLDGSDEETALDAAR